MTEKPSRRLGDLMDSLLIKTKQGAIDWGLSDLPGAYIYDASSGSIILHKDDGPLSEVTIRVLDESGDVVEEFTDPTAATPLSQLHFLIERQLNEGDARLDSLLAEVRSA